MKAVFTTGEAAKLCRVSQQTIIRCFDGGEIRGFRVPGSRFRRIPRESLLRFMKANGIPTDAIDGAAHRVLLVTRTVSASERLRPLVEHDPRFAVMIATSAFEAGRSLAEWRPELVIVDLEMEGARDVESSIQGMPSDRAPKLLPYLTTTTAPELAAAIGEALDVEVSAPDLATAAG